ncbi:MAG: hydantoinase B/oxoprolinase family protein [Dehalococcoidales bacterium]|nr:hydantoinase B/oxoprolinase family protein [Dehalococcoidales bacterium]
MLELDPITFAVVQKKFVSIANSMMETGVRTAVTTFMYEVRDCLFGILDAEGNAVAESHGLFMGTLSPAVKNCLSYIPGEQMEPGDVVISTGPEITGNHTSDAVVFTPIFYRDKIFGFAATKSHWQDLGAKSSYPSDATNIYEEGKRFPPVRLYKKGRLQSDIWGIIQWNSRAPEHVWGDLQAQIAGCRYGEKQIVELLDKYGADTVNLCILKMYDYSEQITRNAIDKLPEGTFTAEDYLDSNGLDLNKPVKTMVSVTIKGSDITVDLTGSAPEQRGPMNGQWVTTLSAVRTAIKSLTTPELPLNEGFNRPIKVIAPKGTIYNPGPTAPCFLCGNISSTIGVLISRALYKILPEKIPACSGRDVIGNGFYGVDPASGRYWTTLTPCYVGQGADYRSDGDSYIMGPATNIPAEILESSFPMFIEKVALIQDSGGAGKYRGGVGSRLYVKALAPINFYSFIENSTTPHWGFLGGKPGLKNYAAIKSRKAGEFDLIKTSGIKLEPDDRVIVTAGGGGGYGNPLQRDIEMVRLDVMNGYISTDSAIRDYGVFINPDTFEVDWEATQILRKYLVM